MLQGGRWVHSSNGSDRDINLLYFRKTFNRFSGTPGTVPGRALLPIRFNLA
jgi:hypothetical protein